MSREGRDKKKGNRERGRGGEGRKVRGDCLHSATHFRLSTRWLLNHLGKLQGQLRPTFSQAAAKWTNIIINSVLPSPPLFIYTGALINPFKSFFLYVPLIYCDGLYLNWLSKGGDLVLGISGGVFLVLYFKKRDEEKGYLVSVSAIGHPATGKYGSCRGTHCLENLPAHI